MTLKQIQKEVKALDKKQSPSDEGYQAAVVILASALNGLKTPKPVADFTGYPMEFVKPALDRLKRNNLGWQKNGQFYHSGWTDEETGGISFWMDVNVALGYVRTVKNKS